MGMLSLSLTDVARKAVSMPLRGQPCSLPRATSRGGRLVRSQQDSAEPVGRYE